MTDSLTHKCSECGFLALREADTHLLLEAPQRYRTLGNVPLSPARINRELADRMPLCFVQKRDFLDSLMAWKDYPSPSNLSPDDVVRLITEEISCDDDDGFTPWRQGFTPKEHRELLDRDKLLQLEYDYRQQDLATQADIARTAKHAAWFQAGAVAVAAVGVAVAVVLRGDSKVTIAMPQPTPALQTTATPPP